jgi:hypothetical protein
MLHSQDNDIMSLEAKAGVGEDASKTKLTTATRRITSGTMMLRLHVIAHTDRAILYSAQFLSAGSARPVVVAIVFLWNQTSVRTFASILLVLSSSQQRQVNLKDFAIPPVGEVLFLAVYRSD